ncbi:hypothetical protein B296_00041794 [Ensete ventricosum]|uniref:Uncharacterized protein n=1 Tax=Ensete ventricosum TaxID=4639 RepID=A0A426X694_ENSVE|nr:hypothetical protein B296_00041794 [Ensete ventricosum]
MSHRACRVDTAPRLAQWRIDAFSSCTYRKSDDPFNQDRPLELVLKIPLLLSPESYRPRRSISLKISSLINGEERRDVISIFIHATNHASVDKTSEFVFLLSP